MPRPEPRRPVGPLYESYARHHRVPITSASPHLRACTCPRPAGPGRPGAGLPEAQVHIPGSAAQQGAQRARLGRDLGHPASQPRARGGCAAAAAAAVGRSVAGGACVRACGLAAQPRLHLGSAGRATVGLTGPSRQAHALRRGSHPAAEDAKGSASRQASWRRRGHEPAAGVCGRRCTRPSSCACGVAALDGGRDGASGRWYTQGMQGVGPAAARGSAAGVCRGVRMALGGCAVGCGS